MSLRVAIVSPFPEDPNLIVGGVAGVSVCLSRVLCDTYGVQVHVVAPCPPSHPSFRKWRGITIHNVPQSLLPGFIDYWSIFRKKVHAKLEEISPDITHFQGVAGWTIGYKKPYVLTIHGITEKDVLYKGGPLVSLRSGIIAMVETKGRKNTRNTIVISPYVLEELRDQVAGRTWAIENPVSDEFFNIHRIHRKQEQARLLFGGSVIERKNVLGLIQAFRSVLKYCPATTLRIVGPLSQKSYVDSCKQYVRRNGLEKKVFFLGPKNTEKMRQELSKASCLALVSFQETAPLIIEEAMAAGVPVVASRICGIPYMVEEGKNGFLVDPNSTLEIASKLLVFLKDQKLSTEMIAHCRKVARQRFHVKVVARETLKVYEAILAE